jgi:hypothetical protein
MVDSKGVDPMQRSDAAGAHVVDAFGRRLKGDRCEETAEEGPTTAGDWRT